MFTGIIKNTGILKKIFKLKKRDTYIDIFSKLKLSKKDIGSSISCSGVCLTLMKCKKNLYTFYISPETLSKTNFKKAKIGEVINLEKRLKYGDYISGHFVQGHVDTIGKVTKIDVIGKSWFVFFSIPSKYRKFVIYKGSICINGISLTISKVLKKNIQVVIIPHTLLLTNLVKMKAMDLVNIEFDILGKYKLNKI